MLVYYFVPFIVSNRYLLFWVSKGHNSVTVQNRTHVYMNFFHHKDLGNHLLQLCPKVVKHPVYVQYYARYCSNKHKVWRIFQYSILSFLSYFTLFLSHICNTVSHWLYLRSYVIQLCIHCNLIIPLVEYYCYILYHCKDRRLSLYSLLCIRQPPDDGRSGQPKHVAVYNKRLITQGRI